MKNVNVSYENVFKTMEKAMNDLRDFEKKIIKLKKLNLIQEDEYYEMLKTEKASYASIKEKYEFHKNALEEFKDFAEKS